MTTFLEARDAILGMVNTKWLADPLTTSVKMLWDDVDGDKPGYDANKKPIPYARTTLRHLSSGEDTIGGEGIGKDEHIGQVVVQIFGPRGRGYAVAGAMAQVVKGFFQRKSITGVDGWFFEVTATEVPSDSDWDQINVSAQFRYYERIG